MAFPRIDLVNLPQALDLDFPLDPMHRDIAMVYYLLSGCLASAKKSLDSGLVPESWEADPVTFNSTLSTLVTHLTNALGSAQSLITDAP